MSTSPPKSTTSPAGILLHGVPWRVYEQLRDEPANDGVRLTYADGVLEVMTPSFRHERWHRLLGRAIEAMTAELGIPIHSGAATTLRNRELEIGLEPDECYWVQNEPKVRGKFDLDLALDPPPDLCIEAEASRSAIDKLTLFRSLGVPEVWRYDGERLLVHVLDPDGQFAQATQSRCLPWLPLPTFEAQLQAVRATDETTWVRGLSTWARALPR